MNLDREDITFWLGITRDHLQFIHDSSAPSEFEFISRSRDLLARLPTVPLELTVDKLEEIHQFVHHVLALKLYVIEEQVTRDAKLSLSPTFIKHSKDELQMFDRLLSGEAVDLWDYHKLWLNDTAGHCQAITCRVDETEKSIKKKYKKLCKDFKELHSKAMEYSEYFVSGEVFPAVAKLTSDSVAHVTIFLRSVSELLSMKKENLVLGTISPLMLDHMVREQSYYIKIMKELDPDSVKMSSEKLQQLILNLE
jgi:hypothetical protein